MLRYNVGETSAECHVKSVGVADCLQGRGEVRTSEVRGAKASCASLHFIGLYPIVCIFLTKYLCQSVA